MIFSSLAPAELRSIIVANHTTEKVRIMETRKVLQEELNRISHRLIRMAEIEIEWLKDEIQKEKSR